MKQTLRVAVLFGGRSPEYGVSLQSAYAVISHMDLARYTPVLIGITRQGDWYWFRGDVEKIPADTWDTDENCVPVLILPNPKAHALAYLEAGATAALPIDAAFPVLHGQNGEDGTVQGLFELAGIPVVGCGLLSSALCMDKVRAHRLVQQAGITVPRDYVLERWVQTAQAQIWAAELGYPLFVKPVKAGSSFGVSKVHEPDALPAAIALARAYDDRVILEQNICGFEVGCAVMGNENLLVGEADEIELSGEVFDFTEKYNLKTASIHVPARLPDSAADRVKQAAQTIYRALDCRGFARVDLFFTPSGEIVFNEVNTIPGFTAHSRFPSMMRAAGMSFVQIVDLAIRLALEDGADSAAGEARP